MTNDDLSSLNLKTGKKIRVLAAQLQLFRKHLYRPNRKRDPDGRQYGRLYEVYCFGRRYRNRQEA